MSYCTLKQTRGSVSRLLSGDTGWRRGCFSLDCRLSCEPWFILNKDFDTLGVEGNENDEWFWDRSHWSFPWCTQTSEQTGTKIFLVPPDSNLHFYLVMYDSYFSTTEMRNLLSSEKLSKQFSKDCWVLLSFDISVQRHLAVNVKFSHPPVYLRNRYKRIT